MTMDPQTVQILAGAMLGLKLFAQLGLEWLDRREVQRHAAAPPEAFRGRMTGEAYQKSVAYSLALGRFGQWQKVWDVLVLVTVLFSGWLPAFFRWFQVTLGSGAAVMAAFCILTTWLVSLADWPFEWWAQFKLEERFGFNTSTQRTWWTDQTKGSLLLLLLGFPLYWLFFKLVEWTGPSWWIWGWATTLAVQILLMAVFPILIMPWFNKFTPLPEGPLRDRLLALAERTRFPVRQIQVMDGSRRSKHSNAYFTGIGRFRKIVLFDTLIEQLEERELEAVLAHEIGHYKKKHLLLMLVGSAIGLLLSYYIIGWLAGSPWFYRAFGFTVGSVAPAVMLCGFLGGVFTFWLSPIWNYVSRRHEYQADAYAARTLGESHSLITALRKMEEKNLSNPVSHRLYSLFYYSHPEPLDREQALVRLNSPG